MKNEKNRCRIIHVKVIGGDTSDIYEIGEALKKFKSQLPFRLEAIITNEKVVLQDVDTLIQSFLNLKKQIKEDEKATLK